MLFINPFDESQDLNSEVRDEKNLLKAFEEQNKALKLALSELQQAYRKLQLDAAIKQNHKQL